jgi:hypothetical protein
MYAAVHHIPKTAPATSSNEHYVELVHSKDINNIIEEEEIHYAQVSVPMSSTGNMPHVERIDYVTVSSPALDSRDEKDGNDDLLTFKTDDTSVSKFIDDLFDQISSENAQIAKSTITDDNPPPSYKPPPPPSTVTAPPHPPPPPSTVTAPPHPPPPSFTPPPPSKVVAPPHPPPPSSPTKVIAPPHPPPPSSPTKVVAPPHPPPPPSSPTKIVAPPTVIASSPTVKDSPKVSPINLKPHPPPSTNNKASPPSVSPKPIRSPSLSSTKSPSPARSPPKPLHKPLKLDKTSSPPPPPVKTKPKRQRSGTSSLESSHNSDNHPIDNNNSIEGNGHTARQEIQILSKSGTSLAERLKAFQ